MDEKVCKRCGQKGKYFTLQVYEGEPLNDGLAEEDCPLCLFCRIELNNWLNFNKFPISEK